jgi:RHS repeat-associated protein
VGGPNPAIANADPYRYAGGYFDTTTGLYHFGQRYYNPTTGRWTQQDSLNTPLNPTNGNRYAYTGDNPTNSIDPTGLFCVVHNDNGGCLCSGVLNKTEQFVGDHHTAVAHGLNDVSGVFVGASVGVGCEVSSLALATVGCALAGGAAGAGATEGLNYVGDLGAGFFGN